MADQFNQQRYVQLKHALNRAINNKDPDKIIEVARAGLAEFDTMGFPDDWSRWERAIEDAEFAKRMSPR